MNNSPFKFFSNNVSDVNRFAAELPGTPIAHTACSCPDIMYYTIALYSLWRFVGCSVYNVVKVFPTLHIQESVRFLYRHGHK